MMLALADLRRTTTTDDRAAHLLTLIAEETDGEVALLAALCALELIDKAPQDREDPEAPLAAWRRLSTLMRMVSAELHARPCSERIAAEQSHSRLVSA